MGVMPRHDPLPRKGKHDYGRAAAAWKRYWAIMRWMALLAVVTVLLSLIYLQRSGEPLPIHMLIATIAGVGLTVLVGTGLMGLLFVSNRSGLDEDAARGGLDDDERD
jgi:RsiW-degrading membrane proteinase PrsW (M82 family)